MPFEKIQFVERSDHTAGGLVAFNSKPELLPYFQACHVTSIIKGHIAEAILNPCFPGYSKQLPH